jgi:hypothetical protein
MWLFFDFGTQRTIFGTNGTLSYPNKVELSGRKSRMRQAGLWEKPLFVFALESFPGGFNYLVFVRFY